MNSEVISKKAKIGKAVFYTLLPVSYIIVCNFVTIANLLWLLPISAFVAVLYTIPFFIIQSKIKAKAVVSIKPFILSDLLYALLPSCGVSFFLSIGIYIFSDIGSTAMLFCGIIIGMFILITLYFWLSYYMYGIVYKKIKSKFNK